MAKKKRVKVRQKRGREREDTTVISSKVLTTQTRDGGTRTIIKPGKILSPRAIREMNQQPGISRPPEAVIDTDIAARPLPPMTLTVPEELIGHPLKLMDRDDLLRVVRTCMVSQRRLEAIYRNIEGETKAYVLEPYSFRAERLMAYDPYRDRTIKAFYLHEPQSDAGFVRAMAREDKFEPRWRIEVPEEAMIVDLLADASAAKRVYGRMHDTNSTRPISPQQEKAAVDLRKRLAYIMGDGSEGRDGDSGGAE